MPERLVLPGLLFASGLILTGVHDYAYRRVGGDDYELGGLLSHAGTDMLTVTIVLALVALVWDSRHRRLQ